LGEVDKAMLHGFDTPCDSILCLLTFTKVELGEIDNAMFQVVEWH
jgi:hypothetical protein